MAALALKDAGIEVIAVGNGEAAVRKIPEVSPDLVLADIFMPVRNGYEVCEFVKHDARYANVPVLLLAGAFDPFDEQEAQRVHADGVLKKPFVPPDPLINAVKTLLAKSAGDRLMAVTVPAEAEAATAESGRKPVAAPPRFESPEDEPPFEAPEEFALPLTREDLDAHEKHEKAAAFAPTKESPAAETDEPEPVVTASRDPSLGEPAFWVPEEESEEGEEAEEAASEDHDLTEHTWSGGGKPAPLRDDPVPAEKPAPAAESQHESIVFSEAVPEDLVQDSIEPAAAAAPPAPTVPAAYAAPTTTTSDSASSKREPAEDTVPLPETWVESAPLELEPLDTASLSESTANPEPAAALPTLAPPPLEPPLPAPPLNEVPPIAAAPAKSVSESEHAHEDKTPALELAKPHEEWADLLDATQEPGPEATPQAQVAKPQVEAKSHEGVAAPEPEAKSHEPLAKPEPEAKSSEPLAKPVAAHQELEAEPQQLEVELEPEFAVDWPPAFIPAVSSAVKDTLASAREIVPAAHTASEATDPDAIPGSAALASHNPGATPLDPEAVEAAVQRVMERMKPQIMELVSRDILRPLVEALMQQELKK